LNSERHLARQKTAESRATSALQIVAGCRTAGIFKGVAHASTLAQQDDENFRLSFTYYQQLTAIF
jgi:hypothetical protein